MLGRADVGRRPSRPIYARTWHDLDDRAGTENKPFATDSNAHGCRSIDVMWLNHQTGCFLNRIAFHASGYMSQAAITE